MRISDWSSDVCSSDLNDEQIMIAVAVDPVRKNHFSFGFIGDAVPLGGHADDLTGAFFRGEQTAPRHRIEGFPINVALPHNPRTQEHTSELQSLMRIPYAVYCLQNKQKQASTTKRED